jgi:glycosyltransferase involved in cell wall biosynthesis
MHDTVRVSYVMATYNRADHLQRALGNVREYLTPDDELVVVDGGSSDGTPDVVRRSRDVVSRFISEGDQGEAHALNKGILSSAGRYIKFLSDDDYLFPDGVRRAIGILEQHPELDALLCGGESYLIDSETGEERFVRNIGLPGGRPLAGDVKNVLFRCNCGIGLFVSRRAVARIGLLDTRFRAVDSDYMARLVQSRLDFRYADVRLFRHTEYPHSGQRQRAGMVRDVCRILVRARRWDLLAWWVGSAVSRRLLGRSPYETTYRGGDGKWDGDLS